MGMLVDFLKFCVNRENQGKINLLNTQKNFNKFYNTYKNSSNNVKEDKYKDILNAIVEAHDKILNTKDESAMDYSEKEYNTAKTLILNTSQNKGYKLTNDDESITKLNSAAFITTAVILESTLVIGLIISLFALVK